MKYSVLPIYRGPVYGGIGYIAVACWTPLFWHQHGIMVTPWTHFVGDNFSCDSFCSRSQETIFRKINSSLYVNTGWNTWCAMVSHTRWSIDTSIVSQGWVQLIQYQCKSRLHVTNQIKQRVLIESSLFDHALYIHHLVQTLRQFYSKSRARDW